MRIIESFGLVIISAVLLGACTTTAGSSASSFAGIGSNLELASDRFEGAFYDTLDMETLADGHYDFDDADFYQLALTGDPATARGFIGVVHSSIYQTSGYTQNLVEKGDITAPLNRIKTRLLDAWGGPAPEIGLVVSAQSAYHGAAYPENFIVLPIGAIIDVTKNHDADTPGAEDELAAFIAHELSHILLGHYKRADESTAQRRINNTAAGLTYLGVAASGMRLIKVGDNYELVQTQLAESSPLVQKALLTSAIASEASLFMTTSASREQEDHADLLAADLLARAGYDPAKVSGFLRRSETAQQAHQTDLAAMSRQQRMVSAGLAQAMGAGQGNVLNDLFASVVLTGYDQFRNRATKTHRSTAKRRENVNRYLERLVSMDSSDAPASISAAKIRSRIMGGGSSPSEEIEDLRHGSARSLLEAYDQAFEAKRLMLSNDGASLDQAAALIQQARAGIGADEAEILWISAQYNRRIGRHDLAVKDLERLVNLRGAAPIMYAELADAYLSTLQLDAAVEAIDIGEKRTGTKAPFFPLRITYLYLRGDLKGAQAVNSECARTKADGLRAKCAEAMVPVNAALAAERERQIRENPLFKIFDTSS